MNLNRQQAKEQVSWTIINSLTIMLQGKVTLFYYKHLHFNVMCSANAVMAIGCLKKAQDWFNEDKANSR